MKYKIIVDKQSRTNPSAERREYEIDIEELRAKGEVYDSLVITQKEDYVMRRLALSEYEVLTVLDNPIKENLPEVNIELFEGENYIYLIDMTGNKFYAEYLIRNEFNDTYVTEKVMSSAIRESANQIELSVSQRFTNIDGEITNINASLELKIDRIQNADHTYKSSANSIVSYLNASADVINLNGGSRIELRTAGKLIIEAGNFRLDVNGNITATGGTIGGFIITNQKIYSTAGAGVGMCSVAGEDFAFWAGSTDSTSAPFRVGHYGDFYCSNATITGGEINLTDTSGYPVFTITSTSNLNIQSKITSYGTDIYKSGKIVRYNSLSDERFYDIDGMRFVDINGIGISIGRYTGTPPYDDTRTETTVITGLGISTPSITQTSLETEKKNFERLNDGLEIVLSTDIYKYNLRLEDDGVKKHIGFIIGDKFNYSQEITSDNNNGVDLYSMIGVAYKAIQQLNDKIERMEVS